MESKIPLTKGGHVKFEDALRKIEKLVESTTIFKIGKTGRKLEERFNEKYRTEYSNITSICWGEDEDMITDWENDLIRHFKETHKESNKNKAYGGGSMEMSKNYQIYVVSK